MQRGAEGMGSHPYISGAGNLVTMVEQLRRAFPSSVNSETVKRLGIAPNNESYVINALQFLGVIDEEGKKTDRGGQIFVEGDGAFQKEFGGLVKDAYADLFELFGDDAWQKSRDDLTTYFRKADGTSDAIGRRQASAFQAFAALAGHGEVPARARPSSVSNQKATRSSSKKSEGSANRGKSAAQNRDEAVHIDVPGSKRDMALTVRIEINLPSDASKETYDNIFKSIRANLMNG